MSGQEALVIIYELPMSGASPTTNIHVLYMCYACVVHAYSI